MSILSSVAFAIWIAAAPAPAINTAPTVTTTTAPTTTTADAQRLEAFRRELTAQRQTLAGIQTDLQAVKKNTEKSVVGDLVYDFFKNTLWEVFGFKKGEKTAIGLGVSILGILLSLIRVGYWFSNKKERPPAWLRTMMGAYWIFLVVTLCAVMYAGVTSPTRPEAALASDDVAKLEKRMRSVDQHLERLQMTVAQRNAMPGATMADVTAAVRTGIERDVVTKVSAVAEDTSYLRDKWTGFFIGLINFVLLIVIIVLLKGR